MKKSLSLIMALMLVVLSLFTFNIKTNIKAEELTDDQIIDIELKNIYVPSETIFSFPLVTDSAYNSDITWTSNNEAVIKIENGWAVVNRPTDSDVEVTLTVTITRGQTSKNQTFNVTVKKGETETNSYKINYSLNGGVNNVNNPTTYKVGETPKLLAPTNGTVEFIGWYLNDELIEQLPLGLSGDITLVAKWGSKIMTSIEVITEPTKLEYDAFEKFNPSGLVIRAWFNDENHTHTDIVADETTEITYDKNILHGNDTKVTITFHGLTTTVDIKVNKIDYDLSNIKFEKIETTYDGLEHVALISGTLPEGLKVEYSDNKLTNAGELTAVASFVEYDEINYNKPEDLTTTIKINKAILTATVQSVQVKPGVTPEYKIVFSGFVNNETEEVLDEEVVFVDNLNGDYSKPGTYAIGIEPMSDNNYEIKPVGGILTITEEDYVLEVIQGTLETTYNGKNQMFEVLVKQAGQTVTGKEIEYKLADGTEFTGATNAGKYEVTVSLKDGEAESLTVTFEIKKATYDLSKVEFKDITVEFDGKAHELVYNNIPEGLKVLVEGDTKLTNVGTAEATISFKNENENYNDVTTTVTATLTITKASLTKVEFDELPEVGFTGEAHEPKVNGKLGEYVLTENDYEITYDRNTDIGTAYVILNGKGNFEGEVQLTFVITESDLAKVRHAKEELEQQITELPETFVLETTNKSKVTWLSTSTALMINEDGTYKAILVENANEVVVYALVQYNNAVDYAKFTFTLPVIDTDTNIKIENVESNIQVKAEQLNDTTLANYTVEGENVVFGYDISLIKDNTSVQPDGKVKVRIPIPTEYLGNTTLKVYHVTENGNVDMNAIPEDGYLVFETDSFSHYFVTIEKVEEEDLEVTVEEMIELPESDTFYQVTGVVRNIYNPYYGNFYLYNLEESVYITVYGLKENETAGNQTFANIGLKEGDIVTLMGVRTSYSNNPQIGSAYYVSHTSPEYEVTLEVEGEGQATLSANKVENGKSVILTVAANEGYKISSIKANDKNISVVAGQNEYEITVNAKTTVKVTFVEDTGEEPVEPETPLKENQAYTISAANADGILYFNGTQTSGRFNGTLTASEAMQVFVEIADGNYKIYFFIENVKTYVVMADKAAGGSFTNDAAAATIFEWNEEKVTLVVEADDNNRAFGTSSTATYTNFSCYDITGNYNWGKFEPVDGTTPEQPETPTEYTLTLNPDGGTLEQTEIKFTDCTKVNLPTDITKDGYTFLGWFEGTTKVEKLLENRNYTLTAQWEESSTGGEEEPEEPETPSGEKLFENGAQVIIAAIRKSGSGNYQFMSSDLGTASTKRYQASDAGTTDASALTTNKTELIWTIEYSNNNYLLKTSNNQYVTWSSGNSGNLAATGQELNIVKNENGTYTITLVSDSTRKLQLNSTATNNYFAFYASAQVGELQIIVLSSGDSEPEEPVEKTDAEKVEADKNALTLPSSTEENLTLPKDGSNGTTISWSSSNEDVIALDGFVIRQAEDVEVTLTATIKLNDATATKEFTVTVIAEKAPIEAVIYELVTDASTLKAGDKIIIVSSETEVAMSTTQNSNNRGQIEITKLTNSISVTDSEVQVLTIQEGNIEGTLAFYTGDGYLYAASSSSNHLRTETTLSDNSSWSIAIDENGIATILAQGTNSRNMMQYNQNNSLFACYAQDKPQKGVAIYRATSSN